MLAMAEKLERDELWDEDQSWSFPKLATAEEDCGIKSAAKGKESPPQPVMGKKRSAAVAAESEDHELHIWTERERRKKMRNMFSNLHSLLSHIPPKADKSTIVDEAVKYIKKLEHTLQELEKRKLLSLKDSSLIQWREAFIGELQGPNPVFAGPEYPPIFNTWTSPNVILNVCGRDAQISVCSVRNPGLLAAVCFMLEKNNLEVLSAHISSDRATCIYMIHARVYGGSDQAFPTEEIFKQAAAEIMTWLSS
ncbi:transcription factor bHLH95-like [Salvia divinorum]|uniref:Transcription factor bHLH95-like n=1 Tax=Salvia divinorum TaxID=28513 RepID=A0ABD1I6W6_SALDI